MQATHLQEDYNAKHEAIEALHKLAATAGNDAYKLSLPLLASAFLNAKKQYDDILPKMQTALSTMGDKAFKSWLLGRILLAARLIQDPKTLDLSQSQLVQLLRDKETPTNAFTSWAIGYLSTLNIELYQTYKDKLLNDAKAVTAEYQQVKDPALRQGKLSDAIWSWIMAIQAAAMAGSFSDYQEFIRQLKVTAHEQKLTDALQKSLLRTSASNDYPAWGIAIVALSAVAINDQDTYLELREVLPVVNEAAKSSGATAEWLLAKLTTDLAAENWHSLTSQPNMGK